MADMFTKEEIKEAIENPKLVIKKGLFKNTPSWDAFIEHMHFEFYNPDRPMGPPEMYYPEETVINGINKREHFYVLAASYLDSEFFPEQQEVIKTLNSLMEKESYDTFSLLNFIGGEKPFQIHEDPRHSFYWQCKGKSIWQSYSYEHGKFILLTENEVEPGDVVFVPSGIHHTVDTPLPRAALSFMYSI